MICSAGLIFLLSLLSYNIYSQTNFDRIVLSILNPASNILLFVLTSAVFYFCFNVSLRELFSFVVFGYAGKNIAFCVYSLIFTNIDQNLLFLRMGQLNLWNGFLYILTYTILYAIFYFVLVRSLGKIEQLSLDKIVLIIFVLAILSNTIISSVAEVLSTDLEDMMLYNLVLGSQCITLTLMLVLNNYNQKSNELKIINKTSQAMLEKQEKQFKFSKANAELLHIKAHDLKHQVATLRKGGEEAEKVLKELEDVIEDYESVIITENKVLNIILSEKWMYCRKHDIKFSCTVNPKALLNIETTKLYSLIGNILDNCIEAVMKFEEKKYRYISMNIDYSYGMSKILTKNYFNGNIVVKNGMPQSTKKDKNNHGFGARSINMIVNDLGGSVIYNTEDNLFFFQATIPD